MNSRERLDSKGYVALRHRSSSKKSIRKVKRDDLEEDFSREYANNMLN